MSLWKSFLTPQEVSEGRCLYQSLTTFIFSCFWEKSLTALGGQYFAWLAIQWVPGTFLCTFGTGLQMNKATLTWSFMWVMGSSCLCCKLFTTRAILLPPLTFNVSRDQGNEKTQGKLPYSSLPPDLVFSISASHYLVLVILGSACTDSIWQKSIIIWKNLLHPSLKKIMKVVTGCLHLMVMETGFGFLLYIYIVNPIIIKKMSLLALFIEGHFSIGTRWGGRTLSLVLKCN